MISRVQQFSALGQEDRLAIFQLLVRVGPQDNCFEDIKRRLKMPGSTLSHHLDALTRSRLLSARRAARFIFYAVNWSETAGLIRFLTEDCCAEMHTKLAAPATAPPTNGDQGACCSQEQPAVQRTVRKAAALKLKREAQ